MSNKPPLRSLTFQQDYRCFKKGDHIDFRPGVNLLVGDQGAGKSTVIHVLEDRGHRSPVERDKVIAIDCPKPCGFFYFDFEQDNPRTKNFCLESSPARFIFGANSRFKSHGETVNKLLSMLEQKQKVPTLFLMDEPDAALSIRSCYKLAGILGGLAEQGHQIIAAIHNPIVVESFAHVYSLEHRQWMDSRDFVNSQRVDKMAVVD
jgi:predicted ATPase